MPVSREPPSRILPRDSRRSRAVLFALAVAAILLPAAACRDHMGVDLLIRGGTVIDGRGGAPQLADVAVGAGRILAIGDLEEMRARRVIDAVGLTVAPGFVDLHSHADLILLADRAAQESMLEAKIRQGVTTVVVGNCGLGVSPANDAAAETLAAVNGWMTPDGVRAGPLGVGEYLARLDSGGTALNVGTLVPHGPLRISAMGLVPGPPTGAQLEAMREALRRGLAEGAFGLSTGLIYPPGMYSDTDELISLAEIVADEDRLFTTHVRGSSEMLTEATHELVEIARRSGARVHHSHLEAVGRRYWERIPQVLALEDAAREDGLRLSHDVFPYTRAATMMAAIFPPWALDGGVPALLERLADPALRLRIAGDLTHRVPEWPPWRAGGWPHNLVRAVGWDGILVASVAPGGPTDLVGKSLARIAEESGRPPFDVVADLMISQQGRVGQLVDQISGRGDDRAALLSILSHPAAAIVSDAEDYGRGTPHPAHAGAFARVLRLNRERDLLPLREIVRRMTSYPASIAGLVDRGLLQVGAPADLTIFDAERVTDRATWAEPRAAAGGIAWVVLNGHVVVDRGRYLGGMHGEVLRSVRRDPVGDPDRPSPPS